MAEMKILSREFFNWVLKNREQLELALDTVKNKKGFFGFPIKSEANELKKLLYSAEWGCRWAKLDELKKVSNSKLEKGENLIRLFKKLRENILLAGGKVPFKLNKLIEEIEKFEDSKILASENVNKKIEEIEKKEENIWEKIEKLNLNIWDWERKNENRIDYIEARNGLFKEYGKKTQTSPKIRDIYEKLSYIISTPGIYGNER